MVGPRALIQVAKIATLPKLVTSVVFFYRTRAESREDESTQITRLASRSNPIKTFQAVYWAKYTRAIVGPRVRNKSG